MPKSLIKMSDIKKVNKSIEINLENFVNVETGEGLLNSLKPGTSVKITREAENVIVDSVEYLIVDIEALDILQSKKIITAKDLGYIIAMARTLKTEFNAMYKGNNFPHTLESISKLLNIHYDNACRLVKKLGRKNILHKYIAGVGGETVLYCINPYLTRRRKTISPELLSVFSNFKK